MADITFDQLASLYRFISFNKEMNGGRLCISSSEQAELLAKILNDDEGNYGVSLTAGNPDNLLPGTEVVLEIGDPRLALGLLARSLDDLLLARKARFEEPRNYFLIGTKFKSDDDEVSEEVGKYRSVLSLINLLKDCAAYLDESKGELVFINNGKFEIPINYTASDLKLIEPNSIERLISSIENDTHKEQKLSILGSAVIELSKSSPPKERFRALLTHLNELIAKFADGYRLFVSSFSYEKVKDELEAAKVEYTSKIHKVFSEIQNQVLGIPVATIIVATQMKQSNDVGYEFWVNTSVLIGCYVFVLLTGLLLTNQIHTLSVLEADIGRQKSQMEHKYSDILKRFTGVFRSLERRLFAQKCALIFVAAILGVGFVMSNIVYFVGPAKVSKAA